jgi:hypothetical protein
MAKFLQLLFMVVMLLVVALAAALLQPEWARDLGLEKWTSTTKAVARELFDIREPAIGPNTAMMKTILMKERVVADLIDGRLTLFETAALFRRLNLPAINLRLHYRGDSEEELLCQQVIQMAWIALSLPNEDAANAFAARLQEELYRHKQQRGTVVLPDVSLEYSSLHTSSAEPVP